jgi:6-phosphofructokinase 1
LLSGIFKYFTGGILMSEIKTIGVLTSGGDAPGMNAAIRAVVRTGINSGMKVLGIKRGFSGLMKGEVEEMTLRSVSDIIHRGGTILKTARSAEFKTEEGIKKGVSMACIFNLDAVIVIGGDGSYRGALDLCKYGVPVMAIPGTIDNDLGCTDYTIGYDTALNTVLDAIDKIKDTAYSHERCSVLEVMGRKAGYIALNVGIAGGSEVILIPENPFDIERDVIKPIIEGRNRGKNDYSVIVAEGVGGAIEIAQMIQDKTGIESRYTILGHIQRGGSPTVIDRVMASRMAAKAVELLSNGIINRAICVKDNKIVDEDLEKAIGMKKEIDRDIIELSKVLSL